MGEHKGQKKTLTPSGWCFFPFSGARHHEKEERHLDLSEIFSCRSVEVFFESSLREEAKDLN